MSEAREIAAINMARDLCLKLIERRALSPDQLAGAMSLLTAAAVNLFAETDDGDGLWLVRLGRDFTLKLIERGQVAGAQAAAVALGENTRLAIETAAGLAPEVKIPALNAARDLVLKMTETGRLSKNGMADLFREIALSVGDKELRKN
ncbi:hypothetical protein C4J81_00415 [Deltaproteobacteria bacterium Smac51]|nr:hypothetical protein C4J81_00415 [Deltaproteobacteria bacterium Smac51]